MSIEKTIEANTAAIVALTAALSQIVTIKANAVDAPPGAKAGIPSPAAGTGSGPITFESLKTRFLKLVGKDRPAAEALLKKFGINKLTEAKQDKWADIDSAIGPV
jgi:hypothetical protein